MSTNEESPGLRIDPEWKARPIDLGTALDLSLRFSAEASDRGWRELNALKTSGRNTRTTVWVGDAASSAVKITITTGEPDFRGGEDDEGVHEEWWVSIYTVTAEVWAGWQWSSLATVEHEIYSADLTAAIGVNDSQPTVQHEVCATKVFDQLLRLAEAVA